VFTNIFSALEPETGLTLVENCVTGTARSVQKASKTSTFRRVLQNYKEFEPSGAYNIDNVDDWVLILSPRELQKVRALLAGKYDKEIPPNASKLYPILLGSSPY
jgi:hypothetical protein